MKFNQEKLINSYLISLRETLLYSNNDYVEEKTVEEYHAKLKEIEILKNCDLSFSRITREDVYFTESLDPFGFIYSESIEDTTSSATGEPKPKNEKIFYRKDRLFNKLDQVIRLFSKNNKN